MVPKQRHTKSRRNRRRSHQALKSALFLVCPKCSSAVLPHIMCSACGYYQNREVINVKAKLGKKEAKESLKK